MTLYMLNSTLGKGSKVFEVGSYSHLEWMSEKNIQILIDLGKVRQVRTPPLVELAGWKTRGATLKKHGVHTIEDFLECDLEIISKFVRRTHTTVKKWRLELENWAPLQVNMPKGR